MARVPNIAAKSPMITTSHERRTSSNGVFPIVMICINTRTTKIPYTLPSLWAASLYRSGIGALQRRRRLLRQSGDCLDGEVDLCNLCDIGLQLMPSRRVRLGIHVAHANTPLYLSNRSNGTGIIWLFVPHHL
jgi:hypothetical protein